MSKFADLAKSLIDSLDSELQKNTEGQMAEPANSPSEPKPTQAPETKQSGWSQGSGVSQSKAAAFQRGFLGKDEKGVHERSIIPNRSTPKMEDKNSSAAGDEVRHATGGILRGNAKARAMNAAKDTHRAVLKELKEMPKPNLPKSEYTEKSSWEYMKKCSMMKSKK